MKADWESPDTTGAHRKHSGPPIPIVPHRPQNIARGYVRAPVGIPYDTKPNNIQNAGPTGGYLGRAYGVSVGRAQT